MASRLIGETPIGLFDGIQTAKVNQNRYIKSGHYLARIDAVKAAKNRSDGDLFAVEMTNLYTFPDGQVPLDGQFHLPGEAFSEVISKSGSKDMFLPRIKGFLMSVLNATDDQITPAVAEQVTAPIQPLAGLIVELIGLNIVTKAKGVKIVRVEWKGQVAVARVRALVPADVLARNMDEATLTALEARQKAAGIGV